MIRYKFYFAFSLLLVSGVIFAQVNPTPSERNITIEEPVVFKDSLPKITLPDFVITGQEKINVESSKKLEFEESRIFSLADQPPNFINKDVSTRATDITLKKLNAMDNISMFNGFLKAQAGNFTSFDLSGGLGYSYNIYFATLYGGYLSRKEHNIKNSGFSTGNIGVTLGANIPKTNNIFSDATVKLNVGYDTKNYTNYYGWFESGSEDYLNRPSRHYNSFFINSSIMSDKEEYYKYRVSLYFDKYENKFNVNDGEYYRWFTMKQDIEENKFGLSIGGDYSYERFDFSGDMLFYNNSYSIGETVVDPYEGGWSPQHTYKKSSFIFGFFANGSTQLSKNFFATAGFKFYIYDYLRSVYSASIRGKDISKGAILPQLALRYENRNNFSLSLIFNPDLKIMDFQQLHKLNPYTFYQEMNHTLNPINLFLRFDLSAIKNLRILADIGYLEEKRTPYFYGYDYVGLSTGVEPYSDYFSQLYDATTKGIYSNLKMEYNINESNMISLAFNYQNKKIDSLRVPFVPQISASLNYLLFLYDNKLKINPSIEFMGDRVSPNYKPTWLWSGGYTMEDKEDAVVLVNLDVEYLIIKNLVANLTVTNMLNSKYSYYRGYQEYPFSIFVGLKFKW